MHEQLLQRGSSLAHYYDCKTVKCNRKLFLRVINSFNVGLKSNYEHMPQWSTGSRIF